MGVNVVTTHIPCLGLLILKYGRCKLQQDWERVIQFMGKRDASYSRQLRALEMFMADLCPALTPVYVGQCTGRQDELQEDSAVCPTATVRKWTLPKINAAEIQSPSLGCGVTLTQTFGVPNM